MKVLALFVVGFMGIAPVGCSSKKKSAPEPKKTEESTELETVKNSENVEGTIDSAESVKPQVQQIDYPHLYCANLDDLELRANFDAEKALV